MRLSVHIGFMGSDLSLNKFEVMLTIHLELRLHLHLCKLNHISIMFKSVFDSWYFTCQTSKKLDGKRFAKKVKADEVPFEHCIRHWIFFIYCKRLNQVRIGSVWLAVCWVSSRICKQEWHMLPQLFEKFMWPGLGSISSCSNMASCP